MTAILQGCLSENGWLKPTVGMDFLESDYMANVIEVDDTGFQSEVLQSTKPVLVDFWASWCMPCRMIAPVVEELAAANADSIKVVKVNIDSSPNLAATHGVSSIPTLMLFKNGEVVDRFVGVQPKNRLQSAIDEATA